MNDRIKKLQKTIAGRNFDAILITSPANIFYLTGINNFDSEKGFLMVVLKNDFLLISSLFYQNRISNILPSEKAVYVPRGESISGYAAKTLKNSKIIGFERENLSYSRYETFKKALRGKKLLPVSGAVEEFRKIKNSEELAMIKKAASITDKTFAAVLKLVKPGITELFIKRKVLEIMQDLGAQGCAFDPIIASAKFSADPHYGGSNKKIKAGEMIVIDIGARYKNYDADMTRMVFVGKAPQKYINTYNIVLEIQKMALKDCKAGISPKQVYDNAVENFKKYGEDWYFTHGLGHGVGINIHELPNLNDAGIGFFENGMVFTVEPGLYHSGWGGIRIEDLCVIENGFAKTISKTPKNIIEIPAQ
jgi:Xaa-Pro aminopeptidase